MDTQILNRPRQASAGLRLVRWLQAHYGIKTGDIVGRATANDSRFFMDKTGIKNGAGDWFAAELSKFKARLLATARTTAAALRSARGTLR